MVRACSAALRSASSSSAVGGFRIGDRMLDSSAAVSERP